MAKNNNPSSLDDAILEISPFMGDVLFESLPDVQFFVKDSQGLYIKVNQALKNNYLMATDDEILGKTDRELFPNYLADNYIRDDQQVLRGTLIKNRIELVGRHDGSASWSTTTKAPLRNAQGQIIGLAGITRDMGQASLALQPFQRLAAVTQHIEENFSRPITMAELAEIAELNVRSLQRKFRTTFRMTPSQYIARIRVIKASKLLATTELAIAVVADATCFADQSHLTRTFSEIVGETPGAFRHRYHR
ncbi:AraC family transcriptional regulator [Mariniblastus fucicola]|uniref:Bifunctional transcriptional activator/DNA repair enzyme AdaA n=1 Tax=Mariniblastus fucicola TaxID=980251 RepID=A0A5B9PE03_9BACT|nr:AraC family transcriptional regulator [Mariniblastus fucicola]QEG24927.1 Bifunctional transcriptional activator/DNA repair enzyme AdaA [Mariniblastus fucicola]